VGNTTYAQEPFEFCLIARNIRLDQVKLFARAMPGGHVVFEKTGTSIAQHTQATATASDSTTTELLDVAFTPTQLGKLLVTAHVIESGQLLESLVVQVTKRPLVVSPLIETKFTFADNSVFHRATTRCVFAFFLVSCIFSFFFSFLSFYFYFFIILFLFIYLFIYFLKQMLRVLLFVFRLFVSFLLLFSSSSLCRTHKPLKLDLISNAVFQIEHLSFAATDEKRQQLDVAIGTHTPKSVGIQMVPENEGNVSIVPKVCSCCLDRCLLSDFIFSDSVCSLISINLFTFFGFGY
jgi:hypothetical protein